MSAACFNCGLPATHRHHVVPRSLGGVATVPLCHDCHGKAHGKAHGFRNTNELTRAALLQLKADGVRLGGEALGWQRSRLTDAAGRRCVVRDDAEAETLARIVALRGEGLSLRAIATTLTAEGRATKRGGRWAAEQVRAALDANVVVAVEDEADTVARILALKADGVSVRRIAEILAAEGRSTKAGGRWHATTVQRVIAREVKP